MLFQGDGVCGNYRGNRVLGSLRRFISRPAAVLVTGKIVANIVVAAQHAKINSALD